MLIILMDCYIYISRFCFLRPLFAYGSPWAFDC